MGTPLDVARSEIDYVEQGGPDGRSGNLTKFWDWWDSLTGEHDQGASWCGCFVAWCFDQAGARFSISGKPGFIYCPAGEAWFRSQGLLRGAAQGQPGDVAFFDFKETDANGRLIPPPHHTGIVEAVDLARQTVTCIEGNTSSGMAGSQSNGGGVYRRTRPWSQVRSVGHVTWVHPPVQEDIVRTKTVSVHVDHTTGKGWAAVEGVPQGQAVSATALAGADGAVAGAGLSPNAALDGSAVVNVDLHTPTLIDVHVDVLVAFNA